MFTSVIVKRTDIAEKVIAHLKEKGVFTDAQVINFDGGAGDLCAKLKAEIVFIEAENGFSALVDITTRLNWKKFRLFAFNLTDGVSNAKFYVCYGESCFSAFPNKIFNQDFSIEKFESYE